MATKTTKPISEKRNANPTGCLVIFGLIFLLAGLGSFYAAVLRPISQVNAAKSWTPITATITSSQIASSSDSDGTTYRVAIEYSFPFNGRAYFGNQYSFAPGSSSNYSSKQAIVAGLPVGAQTTIYANPANPHESVINRGATSDLWLGMFTLIFVVAGLGIILLGLFSGRNAKGSYSKAQTWQPQKVPVISAAPVANLSGPVTLKPRTSKATAFIVMLIFGLFWNGIVFFFLAQTIRKPGGIEVFLGLFMIPFVLVGIAMIGATIHQFLALFGPKVELTVSQAQVPLGGAIKVNWKLNGKQNVTKLQIYLEGREEATYRRGTDTYTDKNTFCVLDVTDAMSQPQGGEGMVQIPAGTMHSFEASNNKILWQLVVKGEIPIWPNIKEEYPLVVLPQ